MRIASPPPHAAEVTAWRHARSVALLPAMNTIVIPALISARFGAHPPQWPLTPREWLLIAAGTVLLAGGIAAVVATIGAFVRRGEGTLAPWDPPRALVVDGLYARCRNPMKTGLFAILAGEAALLQSLPLLGWLLLFALVNAIYIRLSEEPGLRRRFGREYEAYSERVPRWLPRLRPHSVARSGPEDPA